MIEKPQLNNNKTKFCKNILNKVKFRQI